jgi:hypothetical protein
MYVSKHQSRSLPSCDSLKNYHSIDLEHLYGSTKGDRFSAWWEKQLQVCCVSKAPGWSWPQQKSEKSATSCRNLVFLVFCNSPLANHSICRADNAWRKARKHEQRGRSDKQPNPTNKQHTTHNKTQTTQHNTTQHTTHTRTHRRQEWCPQWLRASARLQGVGVQESMTAWEVNGKGRGGQTARS